MWYKVNKRYVGTKQVRPYKWSPWSNTLAYFPLTENQTDQVWNAGINLTWTKQNVGFYFNATGSIDVTNLPSKPSFWAYWVQLNRKATSTDTISFFMVDGWPRFIWADISWAGQFKYVNSSSSFVTWGTAQWHNLNTWYHLAFGWDWTNFRAFHNWNLVWSWTATFKSYTGNSVSLLKNNWWAITVSDVIFENRLRTAQEIQDYYNNTKSNYWL